MPSDPNVTSRVRQAIEARGFEHRHFFGGDAWFWRGNFALGVHHDNLVCRIGPDAAEQAVASGTARPMDITGKPMRGWVFVAPPAFKTEVALRDWIDQVFDFVSTLPVKPKQAKVSKKRARKTAKHN